LVDLPYPPRRFVTSTYKPFEVFTIAGIAYIVIIAVISMIVRGMETFFNRDRRAEA